MHQAVYPEQGTQERRRGGEAAHGVGACSGREASAERSPFRATHATRSDGLLGAAYDRFVRLPAPVVLAALWVLGMALLGSGVLMLYAIGGSLASLAGGA